MAMSEEEKSAYLAEITPAIEAAADAVFLKLYGRTYNDADVKRAEIPHAHKNGDASTHPADSWQQIKQDFPSLFGGAT